MSHGIQASIVSVKENTVQGLRLMIWVDGKLVHTSPHQHKGVALQAYRNWLKAWKGAV